MPWNVERRGDKYCVVNEDTNETVKCHSARSDAVDHMQALYANVDEKEVDMDEETLEKFIGSMGPTSFDELDALVEEREKASEMVQLTSAFHFLVDNVLADDGVGDKGAAIKNLANELSDRLGQAATKESSGLLDKLVDYVKGKSKSDPLPTEKNRIVLTKNSNGEWVWFAKYSNKFRDNDSPPEIIAEESHLRFNEKVNSGLAPHPELWLWHIPGTTWGKSSWVGYDSNGFALAAGFVDPEYYDLAEVLHGREDILLSHGMPTKTIIRDPEDSSIIVEHETREISVLPYWAAANKLTGFVVLKENTDMSKTNKGIEPEDRKKLIDDLGLPPDIVDRMEASNKKDANLADAVGLEFKETEEVEEELQEELVESDLSDEEVEAEHVEAATEVNQEEEEAEEAASDSDDEDIKQAIVSLIKAVEVISERLEEYKSDMDVLKQTQDKLHKDVGSTPLASRASLMIESVIGKSETRIEDGRTKNAKDGPKETDPNEREGLLFFQKQGWV